MFLNVNAMTLTCWQPGSRGVGAQVGGDGREGRTGSQLQEEQSGESQVGDWKWRVTGGGRRISGHFHGTRAHQGSGAAVRCCFIVQGH